MSDTFLIIGLGNPGERYAQTRHNAGFWFLGSLLEKAGARLRAHSRLCAETVRVELAGQDCILARPTTFMNDSGRAVRAVMDYYKVPASQMLVAYDELDLGPGTIRLKEGGGHGGHNGMRDIFAHVADRGFLRLRIGIGHPGIKDAVVGYVLSRPAADDEKAIREGIGRALDVIPQLASGELPAAMKSLHTGQGIGDK